MDVQTDLPVMEFERALQGLERLTREETVALVIARAALDDEPAFAALTENLSLETFRIVSARALVAASSHRTGGTGCPRDRSRCTRRRAGLRRAHGEPEPRDVPDRLGESSGRGKFASPAYAVMAGPGLPSRQVRGGGGPSSRKRSDTPAAGGAWLPGGPPGGG